MFSCNFQVVPSSKFYIPSQDITQRISKKTRDTGNCSVDWSRHFRKTKEIGPQHTEDMDVLVNLDKTKWAELQ